MSSNEFFPFVRNLKFSLVMSLSYRITCKNINNNNNKQTCNNFIYINGPQQYCKRCKAITNVNIL